MNWFWGSQRATLILPQNGHFGRGVLFRWVASQHLPMLRKHWTWLRCRSWSPANYPPWIVEWRCAKSLLIAQLARRTRGVALWCSLGHGCDWKWEILQKRRSKIAVLRNHGVMWYPILWQSHSGKWRTLCNWYHMFDRILADHILAGQYRSEQQLKFIIQTWGLMMRIWESWGKDTITSHL